MVENYVEQDKWRKLHGFSRLTTERIWGFVVDSFRHCINEDHMAADTWFNNIDNLTRYAAHKLDAA